MADCLIALGSNLGDRAAQLQRAFVELARLAKTMLVARSGWHETPPIGGPGPQGPFINAAALLSTSLEPAQLLSELQRIEDHFGRRRETKWAARPLDLDLALYDDVSLEAAELSLPHPRLCFRRFMLEPAVEIAPWMVHVESGWTLQRLLDHLNGSANLIAVAASDAKHADAVIERVTAELFRDSRGAARALRRLGIHRWSPERSAAAPRPKLLLAAKPSSGTNWRDRRKILQLPAAGPVAWIGGDFEIDLLDEAIAAVQAVWPELAGRPPSS
jgi:2-amino-4-hydroxy-6-hydroxymethyldihydropteridine diphosphokinase